MNNCQIINKSDRPIESKTTFNHLKYSRFSAVNLKQRQWPNKIIKQAPRWCSVDLRDGNQALINPLSVEQRLEFFKILVAVGFKEIEVGFPSASIDDFNFVQLLIKENYIPDDVTIAVLTPAREAFIKRSFDALVGAKQAIIHLYNSTSKIQRETVFNLGKTGITHIAVNAAKIVADCAKIQTDTTWQFQYSPESFSATELDYAVEICNAVVSIWQADIKTPVILNLPSTVEMSMPNIFADQIEWFCNHIDQRDHIIISVHTHNDRGCAVAAAEMAVLAGADRVEGTLLGNGERTGNMDIITMAMNIYSQGIDPKLNLSSIQQISERVSQLIDMAIHPRHPYIGDLVFTAFSGSHQDAIRKCLVAFNKNTDSDKKWEVAYLPIDPADLGRSYQEIIRINSQSGKGGIAYLVEQALSTQIPRWLQVEFSKIVQIKSEKTGNEILAGDVVKLFQSQYLHPKGLVEIEHFHTHKNKNDEINFVLSYSGKVIHLEAKGIGVLDCFISALSHYFSVPINIIEYNEQTLKPNTKAQAIAFIQLQIGHENFSGIAIHNDIVMGSLKAILQALSGHLSQIN